jgi:hypothetical protein
MEVEMNKVIVGFAVGVLLASSPDISMGRTTADDDLRGVPVEMEGEGPSNSEEVAESNRSAFMSSLRGVLDAMRDGLEIPKFSAEHCKSLRSELKVIDRERRLRDDYNPRLHDIGMAVYEDLISKGCKDSDSKK